MRFNKLLGIACALFLTGLLMVSGARLPTVGSDSGSWGAVLNEFLEAEHAADGTHKNVTVGGDLIINNASGNQKMIFNASLGRLAIGTPNFTYNGLTRDLIIRNNQRDPEIVLIGRGDGKNVGGAALFFGADLSGQVYYQFPTEQMRLVTNSSIRVLIDSKGRVGINDLDPAHRLTVIGNLSVNKTDGTESTLFVDVSKNAVGIRNSDPSAFNANADDLVVGTNNGSSGITVYSTPAYFSSLAFANGTSGSDAYSGLLEYSHSLNSLAFYTSGSKKVTITQDGKVGINTPTPSSELTVVGSVNITSNLNVGRGTYRDWQIGSDSFADGFYIWSPGLSGGYNGGYAFAIDKDDADVSIPGSGNLGVGTNDPASRLDVRGNVSATGNMTLGTSAAPTNLTMYSPDGSGWRCGPDNSGAWTCS